LCGTEISFITIFCSDGNDDIDNGQHLNEKQIKMHLARGESYEPSSERAPN